MDSTAAVAKTGLDDYLVAGGTVQELLLMARPFEPVDLARERLKRDEGLQAAIAERQRILDEMPLKTPRQNTAAAVVRALTREAEKSGELVERKGQWYLRVEKDRRTLSEEAAKSKKSVNGAIEYLEDFEGEGRILRDSNGRQAHKAGAFLLPVPIAQKGTHNGGSEEKRGRGREATESFSENFSPLSNGAYDRGGYPSALEDVPALRYPKVILYRARREGRDVVAATHYVRRLGPKRENIVRYVLEAGEVPEAEVMERFAGARTRPWDFRRRTLGPLLGILTVRDPETREVVQVATGPLIIGRFINSEGVAVLRALPGCLEALEHHREAADEIADAERQREKHADERKKFRENYPRRHEHPADAEPELMGKEKVRPIIEARRAEDERARIEHQRQKVGETAEVFLADALDLAYFEGEAGVQYREVRERWIARGGKGEDLRCAVFSGPFKFEPGDAGDGPYVYPADLTPRPDREEPASVVAIPNGAPVATPEAERTRPRKPYKREDGVYVHPPDCACEWCGEPPARSYAKIGGTA